MHGRVKVRSSEEKAVAEQREKAEKVRAYRELTTRIFAKRAAGEKDGEALRLTRDVLCQNPDIATLWNYRREIVTSHLSSLPEEEAVKVCGEEKTLTQQCLKVNPKSYCVWLHRQWVLERSPQPDWTSEVSLCNLFLKYDERNFHCWDYRRFVASKAAVSPTEEFSFTHDRIAANFSNYSAWHYRSKLLPLLHPSPDRPGGVAETALLQEHELAQNAFFTDPSDQSAWLYHRWLLGKTERPTTVACVLVREQPQPEAFFTFSRPTKGAESVELAVSVSSSVKSDWPKSLWRIPLNGDVVPSNEGTPSLAVVLGEGREEVGLAGCGDEGNRCWVGGRGPVFGPAHTATTSSMLAAELDSCKELLQMEPDNKWCLLTTLWLMQALDWRGSAGQIVDMYHRLCEVDRCRRGYYQDMLSRFHIECLLADMFQDGLSPASPTSLDLSGKGLCRLYHTEYLLHIHTLNLSHNQLTSLTHVENLVSLETLVADNNKLQGLPPGAENLQLLKVLSIRNNEVSDPRQLHHVRVVKVLRLQGNPLCDSKAWRKQVTDILRSLEELNNTSVSSDPQEE